MAMAVAGLVGGLLALIPARTCHERFALETDPHPLRLLVGSLLRNRAWIVVTITLSLFYINLTAFYGLSVYYSVEILHRPEFLVACLFRSWEAARWSASYARPVWSGPSAPDTRSYSPTSFRSQAWHFSRLAPTTPTACLAFWPDLLLSGADAAGLLYDAGGIH
ncbi:hypothetical protein RAA17_01560 [Komagataeibacter rhaeticus]|nr:hypothetical protein [Komagataeibacter rhaeticus]